LGDLKGGRKGNEKGRRMLWCHMGGLKSVGRGKPYACPARKTALHGRGEPEPEEEAYQGGRT